MDDDIVEFAKRVGMDPSDFEGNEVGAVAKRLGLRRDRSAEWNAERVLATGAPQPDPWDGNRELLDEPFEGPIPVVLVGEMDLRRPGSLDTQMDLARLGPWQLRS